MGGLHSMTVASSCGATELENACPLNLNCAVQHLMQVLEHVELWLAFSAYIEPDGRLDSPSLVG